jgi:hypothetical protein
MSAEASGLRERIRQAVAGPVGEAEKLLNDLGSVNSETRLSILISGWGRGLSAALEELAMAVDELRQQGVPAAPEPASTTATAEPPSRESTAEEQATPDDTTDATEGQLLEEAKKSREQTAELAQETEEARRVLEQ